MARLNDIVFDCEHPARLARFWAAVLDGYAVAEYDAEELERLRALGITDTEDDPNVLVESARGGPLLWFQRVPETKVVKNRVHVDLRTDDLDAELARLTQLGARIQRRDDDNVILTDPQGNEFCIAES